jgi:hypothetical protein
MLKSNAEGQVIESPTVVVVASDAERVKLARLERSLRVKLRACGCIAEAVSLLADAQATAVITRACDPTGVPVAPALARLRCAAPSVGVVVLVDRRSPSRATVAALRMADGVLFDKKLDRFSVGAALRNAMARR